MEKATARLQAALEEQPENVQMLYELGTIVRDAGDGEHAHRLYRRALELDAGPTEALDPPARTFLAKTHVNVGVIAFQAGDQARSLAHFRRAAALDPSNEHAARNIKALEDAGVGRE